jgi:16S rRNA (guanine1207-N2)-methyltransferase
MTRIGYATSPGYRRTATVDAVQGTPRGHYFDPRPAARHQRRTVSLILPDGRVELVTDRGLFSPDRIDPGTSFLLSDGPPIPVRATDLLDLGCGYGPIATTLARRAPGATVWAVDVNERARQLCRENAERLGLPNVRVLEPEEVPVDVRFDAVWSNPPIRIGKQALHELLLGWLARIRAGGELVLVVHKHLGADSLQRWLAEHGHPTERLGSRGGYRLLRTVVGRAQP